MLLARQLEHQKRSEREFFKHATSLLTQQIWCWGRDILRADGNWLLETGFTRIEPPVNRKKCTSVYSLELPQDRRVILRGFGVFYGDSQRGGVFLPRNEFRPKFTTSAKLDPPPWSGEDLPKFRKPTETQQNDCLSLTLDLIDWIRSYESNLIEQLGIGYRQSTLDAWDINKQPITPAEEMALTWRMLGVEISHNFQMLFPQSGPTRSQKRG